MDEDAGSFDAGSGDDGDAPTPTTIEVLLLALGFAVAFVVFAVAGAVALQPSLLDPWAPSEDTGASDGLEPDPASPNVNPAANQLECPSCDDDTSTPPRPGSRSRAPLSPRHSARTRPTAADADARQPDRADTATLRTRVP